MASIKCGSCKNTHASVSQVRACYGQRRSPATMPAQPRTAADLAQGDVVRYNGRNRTVLRRDTHRIPPYVDVQGIRSNMWTTGIKVYLDNPQGRPTEILLWADQVL